jgi:GT2 family glycosyltransferase
VALFLVDKELLKNALLSQGGDVVNLRRFYSNVTPGGCGAPKDFCSGISTAVCTYKRPESLGRFLRSLLIQERATDQLLIVDASPAPDTERLILESEPLKQCARELVYIRVTGNLRGLTRQRNVALHLASRDLIAFFDDDIVLNSSCLRNMESILRRIPTVAGVGARITNESHEPGWRWRLMYLLGAIPDLVPGRYHRSGFSVPLRLMKDRNGIVDVERLQGGCVMWRTSWARELGFAEQFEGYSQSEDVEFSRRIARAGRLVVCAEATVEHHQVPVGRPNVRALARMGIFNRYFIQRTTLQDYGWADLVRFGYANALYTLILAAGYLRQRRLSDGVRHVFGSALGTVDSMRWKFSPGRSAFGNDS